MSKILIIGATSAIAQETARCYAENGHDLALAGRSKDKLEACKNDLLARGASTVNVWTLDALDTEQHPSIINEIWDDMEGIDITLIAHGSLGDQSACEQDYVFAEREFKTNFLSVVSLTTPIAARMEKNNGGTIGVISSVAGLRGRKSNYIYGAAKGGLNVYLAGLRNRLTEQNVHVLTILPGFVDTPMTAEMDKGPLFASARTVGRGIYKALGSKKNVVYLPFFWQWIMLIIRCIPEPIFKRLSL